MTVTDSNYNDKKFAANLAVIAGVDSSWIQMTRTRVNVTTFNIIFDIFPVNSDDYALGTVTHFILAKITASSAIALIRNSLQDPIQFAAILNVDAIQLNSINYGVFGSNNDSTTGNEEVSSGTSLTLLYCYGLILIAMYFL